MLTILNVMQNFPITNGKFIVYAVKNKVVPLQIITGPIQYQMIFNTNQYSKWQVDNDKFRIQIALWTHKRHFIAWPHG